MTEDGSTLTSPADIKLDAAAHFESFLNSTPQVYSEIPLEELTELVDYRCSNEAKALLMKPVEEAEITETLFSMPPNKAPGPDGYPMEFYRAAWSVIRKDFVTTVQSFFHFGFMPHSINATLLSLVPNTTDAEKLSDFRPIACCNVIYKVISKILARRLKATLPAAIEMNQCAFVDGRLLLKNVLLATEIVKDYHKSSVSSRSAMKLDISKAFDTVRWSFIENILRAMNYPDLFVTWIMTCISTAAFSVSVNGELEGFFTSCRGIRQGCSLSPYLYVIVSNVLSKLLNKAMLEGRIGFHPQCKEVNLSHLSFADDIMITDGTPESLHGTLQVFDDFATMSGLRINVAKSTVFSAGRGKQVVDGAAAASGLSISALPIKYLGLPLTTKIMTRSDYEPLITKIRNRLLSWSSKTLSYAGRLVLIKSVIASITNFWCAAFCLPQGCIDEIESMCSAFLWSGSPNITTRAKVSWEEVCCPYDEGGLGIRRVADVSLVFQLKLIWRLFTKTSSLWVQWVKQYLLRDETLWDERDTGLGSWLWRKLLRVRSRAQEFLRFEVKDGNTARFWTDLWHPLGRLIEFVGEIGTQRLGLSRDVRIREVLRDGVWRFRRCRDPLIRSMIVEIEAFNLILTDGRDEVLWKRGVDDFGSKFVSSATWNQIRQPKDRVAWSKLIWFSQRVPRYAFITWLAIRDRLSTGHRTSCWGQPQCCNFCGETDETRDHLFFACPYTFMVWLKLAGNLFGLEPDPDWETTLSRLLTGSCDRLTFILLRLALQATIYFIWRERNERKHNSTNKSVDQLARLIDKAVRNRISSTNYVINPKLHGLMIRWFEAHSNAV